MKIKIQIDHFRDQEISDQMVVNPDDWNFYRHCYVIGHEFGAIAVVFAAHEQDALDEACDKGFMKCFEVTDPAELEDFRSDEPKQEFESLGNCCVPHKLDYMWIREIAIPAFSFCALLAASTPDCEIIKE